MRGDMHRGNKSNERYQEQGKSPTRYQEYLKDFQEPNSKEASKNELALPNQTEQNIFYLHLGF
jgi:hypothetical protein